MLYLIWINMLNIYNIEYRNHLIDTKKVEHSYLVSPVEFKQKEKQGQNKNNKSPQEWADFIKKKTSRGLII